MVVLFLISARLLGVAVDSSGRKVAQHLDNLAYDNFQKERYGVLKRDRSDIEIYFKLVAVVG